MLDLSAMLKKIKIGFMQCKKDVGSTQNDQF